VTTEAEEIPMNTKKNALVFDLTTIAAGIERRRMLQMMMGASLFPLLACGDDANADDVNDGGVCSKIPTETAGPYPGDGSNGANALALSGVVRSDIRSSFAGASGVAAGVVLTVRLRILDADCNPLAGRAVYLWHCDQDGNYSMYSSAVVHENFLRGVQESQADGYVSFTTIFPGCYSGRWPHIHFEVYPSVASISASSNKIATSQLALPQATCNDVYATQGYASSVTNLSHISLQSDNVFSDGASLQTPGVLGSVETGITATLDVRVA
jgi:protocatechuate 3,4-dioxygenase beta subunit